MIFASGSTNPFSAKLNSSHRISRTQSGSLNMRLPLCVSLDGDDTEAKENGNKLQKGKRRHAKRTVCFTANYRGRSITINPLNGSLNFSACWLSLRSVAKL